MSLKSTIYSHSVLNAKEQSISLEQYRGQVLLIVNTASECGFTSQYRGLQDLYEKFHEQGFQVLAFPCNQFGEQEPGTNEEIAQFCSREFRVTFPVFAKIEVNGKNEDPLFTTLKSSLPGLLGSEGIKWNFTKFLISREGIPVKRYAPQTKPESIAADIQELLASAGTVIGK